MGRAHAGLPDDSESFHLVNAELSGRNGQLWLAQSTPSEVVCADCNHCIYIYGDVRMELLMIEMRYVGIPH